VQGADDDCVVVGFIIWVGSLLVGVGSLFIAVGSVFVSVGLFMIVGWDVLVDGSISIPVLRFEVDWMGRQATRMGIISNPGSNIFVFMF
jgi:hypothetical protein